MTVLREEVSWFAGKMECVLQKNDYKGGWQGMTVVETIQRLREEVDEVFEAFLSDPSAGVFPATPDQIIEECVDVANFAMFLADNVAARRV